MTFPQKSIWRKLVPNVFKDKFYWTMIGLVTGLMERLMLVPLTEVGFPAMD